MSWQNVFMITGGELNGQQIGVTDYLPQAVSSDTWIQLGESYRNQTGSLEWYNTNFNNQIEITSLITSGSSPQGGIIIAKINLVNSNKELVGKFVFKLIRATFNYAEVCVYVEDVNGNILGYSPRNTPQSGYQIPIESGQPIRHFYLALVAHETNTQKIIGWAVNASSIEENSSTWKWGNKQFRGGFFDLEQIETLYGISGNLPEPKKKSPEFGKSSEPSGGYNDFPDTQHGTFDDSSDEIALDAKPTYGVTSVGFINVYKIEQNELVSLGEKLFPHFLPAEILADPSQLSVQEVLVWFIKMAYGTLISPTGTSIELTDNLGVFDILMNGKLIDYVLDCHVIPTSISGATISPLKIGYRTFNDFQLAKATEDYVDVDCGELYIKEFYGNFLDYSGNLKVELYLPMVGFVPIDNEFWNNATIKVIYRFNIIDGSFQAKIFTTREDDKSKIHNSLVAQYGGVCCVHFPITGLQYSNVISGLVNGGTSAVLQGSSGNVAGAVSSAFNMAMLKPDNPSSNGYNASSSFLSHRTPYLVIKMPVAQFSENYPKEIGLPLNVTYPLSQIHGFTIIENPVLNIRCSDEEYNELVSLLRSGVIF